MSKQTQPTEKLEWPEIFDVLDHFDGTVKLDTRNLTFACSTCNTALPPGEYHLIETLKLKTRDAERNFHYCNAECMNTNMGTAYYANTLKEIIYA